MVGQRSTAGGTSAGTEGVCRALVQCAFDSPAVVRHVGRIMARFAVSTTRAVKMTRAPFYRIGKIHYLVQSGQLPNCSTFTQLLGVSRKTVLRDIDFMRDSLDLPIVFNAAKNGYEYTAMVESLPLVTLQEGELVAILVGSKAIEAYRGTPYEGPLKSAFEKITSQLSARITTVAGHAAAQVSIRGHTPKAVDLKTFENINRAVLRGLEVEFDYQKLAASKPERRRLQPYHVASLGGQWYVIGHDLDRNARRTFALLRLTKLKVTQRTFTRPAEFSLDTYLGNAFSAFAGEGSHRVKLRFFGWAARVIDERFWHPTQTLTPRPGGVVDMELCVNGFEELQNWILQWGPCCTVQSPKELRERVAALGREITKVNS
jgi:predicted DNA-binding transcriptional regulator YafY